MISIYSRVLARAGKDTYGPVLNKSILSVSGKVSVPEIP
jgi:hypothetical protein